MAATGNEVARLEQLKGIYPQVVSFVGSRGASITLGNGRVVTFSCVNGGTNNFRLRVRVMYNSFEILQAVSDGSNRLIEVGSNVPMKTFNAKMLGENTGQACVISGQSVSALNILTGDSFRFTITGYASVFIGALIYVE